MPFDLLLLAGTAILAPAACEPAAAAYPKINLAVGYQVDANWPQRPPGIRWRYVTGVAVDTQDRVWMINELDPQVQVYSADGRLLQAWPSRGFKSPRTIRLDQAGHVWITDYQRHVVQKFTPQGSLLLTLGTLDQPGEDATHFNRPTETGLRTRRSAHAAMSSSRTATATTGSYTSTRRGSSSRRGGNSGWTRES